MDTVSAHSKFNRIWIPVAMLMMIVLTPNIRIPGIPSLRLEQFTAFLVILLWMSALAKGKKGEGLSFGILAGTLTVLRCDHPVYYGGSDSGCDSRDE